MKERIRGSSLMRPIGIARMAIVGAQIGWRHGPDPSLAAPRKIEQPSEKDYWLLPRLAVAGLLGVISGLSHNRTSSTGTLDS